MFSSVQFKTHIGYSFLSSIIMFKVQNTPQIQNKEVHALMLVLVGMVYMYYLNHNRTDVRASASQLDLDRAPYVLYGVNYIDPVSLWRSLCERVVVQVIHINHRQQLPNGGLRRLWPRTSAGRYTSRRHGSTKKQKKT